MAEKSDNSNNEKSSFNINISGTTIGRDVNVYNVSRDLNITNQSTPQEFVTDLQNIKNAIANLKGMPAGSNAQVQEQLDSAIAESKSASPDSKKVSDHLVTASDTLEAASKTVSSATVFVEAIKKAIPLVAAIFSG